MRPHLRLPAPTRSGAVGTVGSLLTHGAVVAATLVGGGAAARPADEGPPRDRLMMFVPENSSPPPSAAQQASTATAGDEGSETTDREGPGGGRRAGAREAPARDQASANSEAANSVNILGADAPLGRVYRMVEVDSVALRDTASVAPEYPESLQRRGIEGWVVARFVVDTSGAVIPRSVQIVSSTSSDFTKAVTTALPQMRYRPAVRRGRVVRQEVEQEFRFRVARFP